MDKPVITIFGTGRAKQGDSVYKLANQLGLLLSQAGFTIANGGYGGTMLAAAEGASREDGKIIGVTCSAFKNSSANKYITKEIKTKSLEERLNALVKLGNAYIVLPGGPGTLLELALVWELKNKGFLQTEKPVILLGDFWKPLVEIITSDDPDSINFIKFSQTPEDAVDILKSFLLK
jgi:uncharacterized protein (TIGR00730 family)